MRRPLPAILFAFIIGIGIGNWIPGRVPVIAVGLFLAAVGWYAMTRGRRGWAVAGALLIFWGYLAIQPWVAPRLPADHVVRATDGRVHRITGRVVDRPQCRNDRQRFVLAAEYLDDAASPAPLQGRIQATYGGMTPLLSAGDRVTVSGRLKRPRNFNNPGGFDYCRFLAFKKIGCTLWVNPGRLQRLGRAGGQGTWAWRVARLRSRIGQWIGERVPGPAGAVLEGLTIGIRDGIPMALRDDFNRAGIGHLLAISGLHIGIVAAVAYGALVWLFAWVPALRWQGRVHSAAALVALVPVLGYGVIAGMSPSTQRAVIMVAVYLATVCVWRENDLVNTLAAAALVILILHPPALFAASFLLSFAAVAAILSGMAVLPLFNGADPGQRWLKRAAGRLKALVLVSLFAWLGTLPLAMRYFDEVSVIGLAVNCLLVPYIGFGVVPAALVAVAAHLLGLPGAAALLHVAAGMLSPALALVSRLAALPFAAVGTVSPSDIEIVLYYLVLAVAGAGWYRYRLAKSAPADSAATLSGRSGRALAVAGIFLAVAVVADGGYWIVQRFARPALRMTAIDVGQGSAVLFEFPGGKTMLVDGGGFPDNRVFDMGRRVIGPLLRRWKIRTIDYLVLTHPNSDHLNGLLSVARRFSIGTVWDNGQGVETWGYRTYRRIIRERHLRHPLFGAVPHHVAIGGADVWRVHPPVDPAGHGALLHWADANNNSMVLRVALGRYAFLVPGDIEAPGEAMLAERFGARLKSTVIVAPHHGSGSSNSPALLRAVRPDVAVISAGWHNRFGFPSDAVCRRYRQMGCRVYRTDRCGAVSFSTDGETLRMTTVLDDAL